MSIYNPKASSHSSGGSKKRTSLPSRLRRINSDAAGIDIGSQEHYVAVPADRAEQPVRTFGCLTPQLHCMARWLKDCRIETVAMESTGVYWIPVVQVLEAYGLECLLVDAAAVSNVPGRETDVDDCQWIQQLHSFGLLRGAFRPGAKIEPLRSYWRQREGLVAQCGRQIQLMHKAMEQMNVQLHKVLSDVSGVSGMRIMKAILSGKRDPAALAALCDCRVHADAETVAMALTGDYHEHHLFALAQAMDSYEFHQAKLAECDGRIQKYMAETFPTQIDPDDPTADPPEPSPKPRKNQVGFDLGRELYRIAGVDLTRIDGISTLTAQTIVSEIGFDVSRFANERRFASWLGLCPHNRITGGRIRSRRTRKVTNRVADALRLAAQSLHRSKSALGAFYRRMRTKLGAPKAITAAAHKLARLVYRMLKYGEAFVDAGQQAYEEQYREKRIKFLTKQALALGCQVIAPAIGGVVS